jgi:unsaturated rhamnogalacturonyl hydrolase
MKWANPLTGQSPNFWARAMGWYAMALVDVLDYFPANHPKRNELIAILNRLTAAIEKVQDTKTGLWWDVLNMPNKKARLPALASRYENDTVWQANYLEASASCMFVYAVAKGVRKGYLPDSKISIATKGYDGIINQFVKTENGQTNLYGTVKVSGLGGGNPYRDGSFEYYISEPVVMNDQKGIGAFLLAVNEMELLPTLRLGKGRTVLLDNYFNHEIRKEPTGDDVPFHYIWSEMDNNGYSLFGYVFNKYGVQTKTLATAPTSQNLKEADIYIIVDPDTEKESKMPNYIQAKDIAAIQNWVKEGGELLLMANDSGNVEFQHFNQLAERFGIHFNEDSKNKVQGNNFEQGAIRIPANHLIFTNPKKIYIKELSTIQAKPPATIVLKNGNDNIIAVSKYGKGIVLAVGDPWFYNEYFDGRKLPAEYENYAAANDLVRWLIKPPLSQSSK